VSGPARRRLDAELVRRGLVVSRERAREAVAAGLVTVAGAPADTPSRLVGLGVPIAVAGPPPRFVSRGGEKLDAAVEVFGLEVAGRRVLDAGASTGGFTDCCLQRGAASVVAVDVGYGQLHERLRADPRVEVRERANVRQLQAGAIQPPPDLVVADLSFISLCTVAPALLDVAAPGADLVLLVKPQFEAGRAAVSAGRGVVRDPEVRAEALVAVGARLQSLGASIMGAMVSPLRGADGNVEFLLHAVAPGGPARPSPPVGGPVAALEALADLARGTDP
jgi:23S rRNA (cytidine1920-2'-O)/16S rRNA (cytidine1409-2'-O)-methyltransferase